MILPTMLRDFFRVTYTSTFLLVICAIVFESTHGASTTEETVANNQTPVHSSNTQTLEDTLDETTSFISGTKSLERTEHTSQADSVFNNDTASFINKDGQNVNDLNKQIDDFIGEIRRQINSVKHAPTPEPKIQYEGNLIDIIMSHMTDKPSTESTTMQTSESTTKGVPDTTYRMKEDLIHILKEHSYGQLSTKETVKAVNKITTTKNPRTPDDLRERTTQTTNGRDNKIINKEKYVIKVNKVEEDLIRIIQAHYQDKNVPKDTAEAYNDELETGNELSKSDQEGTTHKMEDDLIQIIQSHSQDKISTGHSAKAHNDDLHTGNGFTKSNKEGTTISTPADHVSSATAGDVSSATADDVSSDTRKEDSDSFGDGAVIALLAVGTAGLLSLLISILLSMYYCNPEARARRKQKKCNAPGQMGSPVVAAF